MTTTGELRAIIADAATPRPFLEIAEDRLKNLDSPAIPLRIRDALKPEGEAFAREFRSWIADPPDTLVRLARLRAFSNWHSKVMAEWKARKP